jgi:hypothetical protein
MDISKISRLGKCIEQRTKPRDYLDDAFARIACEALAELRVGEDSDLAQLAGHALELAPTRTPTIPWADLELPVYAADQFVIELHVWRTSPALVREPDWRGAYMVLFGTGVARRHDFEEDRRINGNLRTGRLVAQSCEFLAPGRVQAVNVGPGAAGQDFFPLDSPTGALVVRTLDLPESPSRLTHFRPSLALSEARAAEDPVVRDALKSTRLAAQLGDQELLAKVMHASLCELDRFRGSYVALFTSLPAAGWRTRFLECVPPLLGDLEEELRHALEFGWAIEDTMRVRDSGGDAELRFALTAYCGAPDAPTLHALLEQRYPGVDPFDLVVGRVSALVDRGALSVAWDPENRDEALLRAFMRGETVEDAMRSCCREHHGGAREMVSEAFELMAADELIRAVRPLTALLSSLADRDGARRTA